MAERYEKMQEMDGARQGLYRLFYIMTIDFSPTNFASRRPVTLSAAKGLASNGEALRCAQGDRNKGAGTGDWDCFNKQLAFHLLMRIIDERITYEKKTRSRPPLTQ